MMIKCVTRSEARYHILEEVDRFRTFQTSVTLTLDRVIWYMVLLNSSTSRPDLHTKFHSNLRNFLWTEGWTLSLY